MEVGPYTIVLGWHDEPVIVGERNALVLEITEGDTPVEGVEGTLELTVFYGGESFIGQVAPSETPGVYTVEIFPTVRGQYEVQLGGTIGDETLDVILAPDEVLPADVLQFPETQPAPNEMEEQIDQLTETVDRLQTTATLGLFVGAAGLLAGAAGLFLAIRRGASSG